MVGAVIVRSRLSPDDTRRADPLVRAVAWTAATVGAGWALVVLGETQALSVDWSDPVGWLRSAPLDIALAAAGRLAGLAMVTWVAASSLAYAAARLAGVGTHSVDWLSIGPIRRLVDALLAGSLVASTSLGPSAALATVDHPPPATSVETVEEVSPAYVPIPAGWPNRVPSADPPAGPAPASTPTDTEESGPPAPSTGPTTVVATPGDHLWGLAESRLREVRDRTPSESEVASYWAATVALNRPRLTSGDPDLIHPGEEILLPEVPVTPGS